MQPPKSPKFTETDQECSNSLSECYVYLKDNIAEEYKNLLTKPLKVVARTCVKETVAKLHAYSFLEKKGLLSEYIES